MARRAIQQKRVRPRPEGTADGVLRRHLAEQLAVVRKSEPRAAKGSVEALHDLRVALRRIRSLAVTFVDLDKRFLERLDRRASKV